MSQMRWNSRDDQTHTLGGHTSLLFQQQTLSTCELTTRIVVHDKGKRSGKNILWVWQKRARLGRNVPLLLQTKGRVIVSIFNYDNLSCEKLRNFKSLLKLWFMIYHGRQSKIVLPETCSNKASIIRVCEDLRYPLSQFSEHNSGNCYIQHLTTLKTVWYPKLIFIDFDNHRITCCGKKS